MSIYNCHKQQPQPWMSYIASNMICYTGECCSQLFASYYEDNLITNGFLYNWYAATSVNNLAYIAKDGVQETGWRVPTVADNVILRTTINPLSGGELKETGFTHWNTPNTGAANLYGFRGLGSGIRVATSTNILQYGYYWLTDEFNATDGYCDGLYHNSGALWTLNAVKYAGLSVRLVRDANAGDADFISGLTDYDGNQYDAVKIGVQVWLVQNLMTTHYANGTDIPVITGDATWAALITGARCSYADNAANASDDIFVTSLLPFQVISDGPFLQAEIRRCGDIVWTVLSLNITEVIVDGFFIISYDGSTLIRDLDCGCYEFRVIAGETWWFERIMITSFDVDTNAYTIRDELMLPLKFSEQQFETTPLIAPCDSFLPFMFLTDHVTSGTVTVYLYDVNANCLVSELTDIDVTVATISGKTYYIHDGACFTPFLECGIYKLEIVDGEHSYFSVPFSTVCDMNDIPDGSRVLLDFNRCVMRDEDGNILYESCLNGLTLIFDSISNAPVADPTNIDDWNTFFNLPINGNSFTDVNIYGDEVRLYGGSNIIISSNLFELSSLISIEDTNSIIETESGAFNNSTLLTRAIFPVLVTVAASTFESCWLLVEVNMPLAISIGDQTFNACFILSTIYIPLCVTIGSTTGNNAVFEDNIGNIITLTVPAVTMTCNGGSPDGDIAYLQANNTVTIIQA